MSLYLGNTKIPGVKVTSSSISSITLPSLSNPAAAGQMLAGYDAINASGNRFVGTINTLTESNITVNENTITIPAGYYATSITKTIESSGNNNLPTLTPTIKLVPSSNTGIITGSWSPIETGIVEAGTYSNTLQLSTQATKTVTPGTIRQTAVDQYKFTTGAVYVAGDSNLIADNIKSGISIFGVTGTYEGSGSSGGGTTATCTLTLNDEYGSGYGVVCNNEIYSPSGSFTVPVGSLAVCSQTTSMGAFSIEGNFEYYSGNSFPAYNEVQTIIINGDTIIDCLP